MKKMIAIGTVMLFGVMLTGCQREQTPSPDSEEMNENPTPVVSPESSGQPANTVDDELAQSGSSYLDPEGRFSFLYPSEYTLDEQNAGERVRIYMYGPTQKGQTEVYDGVIITFEPISLENQSLEEVVDERIAEVKEQEVSEIIEPKSIVVLPNASGFSYTTRGLGEAKHYFLRKDPNSDQALGVTTLVADPGNLGFQEEVDAIIRSVQVLE